MWESVRTICHQVNVLHRLANPYPLPTTINLGTGAHATPWSTEALFNGLFHLLLGFVALQIAFLIRVNKPMDRTMILDSLFLVVLAFFFSLGPCITIELRVAFAARAVFVGEVTVGLDESVVARLALYPLAILRTEQRRAGHVIARLSMIRLVVAVVREFEGDWSADTVVNIVTRLGASCADNRPGLALDDLLIFTVKFHTVGKFAEI